MQKVELLLSSGYSYMKYNILTAVIKTQPYDLLRWSAAYFRCMALNVVPPVKPRLEQNCAFGHLTKGYLRVLLEQVTRIQYR